MDNEGEDHQNGRLGLRAAVRLQANVRERGLDLWLRLNDGLFCDMFFKCQNKLFLLLFSSASTRQCFSATVFEWNHSKRLDCSPNLMPLDTMVRSIGSGNEQKRHFPIHSMHEKKSDWYACLCVIVATSKSKINSCGHWPKLLVMPALLLSMSTASINDVGRYFFIFLLATGGTPGWRSRTPAEHRLKTTALRRLTRFTVIADHGEIVSLIGCGTAVKWRRWRWNEHGAACLVRQAAALNDVGDVRVPACVVGRSRRAAASRRLEDGSVVSDEQIVVGRALDYHRRRVGQALNEHLFHCTSTLADNLQSFKSDYKYL